MKKNSTKLWKQIGNETFKDRKNQLVSPNKGEGKFLPEKQKNNEKMKLLNLKPYGDQSFGDLDISQIQKVDACHYIEQSKVSDFKCKPTDNWDTLLVSGIHASRSTGTKNGPAAGIQIDKNTKLRSTYSILAGTLAFLKLQMLDMKQMIRKQLQSHKTQCLSWVQKTNKEMAMFNSINQKLKEICQKQLIQKQSNFAIEQKDQLQLKYKLQISYLKQQVRQLKQAKIKESCQFRDQISSLNTQVSVLRQHNCVFVKQIEELRKVIAHIKQEDLKQNSENKTQANQLSSCKSLTLKNSIKLYYTDVQQKEMHASQIHSASQRQCDNEFRRTLTFPVVLKSQRGISQSDKKFIQKYKPNGMMESLEMQQNQQNAPIYPYSTKSMKSMEKKLELIKYQICDEIRNLKNSFSMSP